jgi:CheY-like chemotaxis protein
MLEGCAFDPIRCWSLFSSAEEGDGGGSPGRGAAGDRDLEPRQRCVLVVDDEADALDSIVELLETEGYTAMGARNGREALSILTGGVRPDLIVLDLKMPVMDGWDFCAALEQDERFADIPIAIVTASATLHRLPFRRNDAGFFLKPIDFDRLLRVIRKVCG